MGTGSPRWVLHKEDFVKIGKGFVLAIAPAAITYVADLVSTYNADPSTMQGMVIAGVAASTLNTVRKWVADNQAQ